MSLLLEMLGKEIILPDRNELPQGNQYDQAQRTAGHKRLQLWWAFPCCKDQEKHHEPDRDGSK